MIKLRKLITEKQELNAPSIKTLAKLTDINNHTRARLALAQYIGDKRLIRAYQGIMYVEELLRDSNYTNKARARLDKQLFYKAKKKYGNFDDIHGAF